jgi:hypothetical protein
MAGPYAPGGLKVRYGVMQPCKPRAAGENHFTITEKLDEHVKIEVERGQPVAKKIRHPRNSVIQQCKLIEKTCSGIFDQGTVSLSVREKALGMIELNKCISPSKSRIAALSPMTCPDGSMSAGI